MTQPLDPVRLKHSCGCTLPRFDLFAPRAGCPIHGSGHQIDSTVDWAHWICKTVSAPVGGAPDLAEGPRPSTHKLCGCGRMRPFGHYYCGGMSCLDSK